MTDPAIPAPTAPLDAAEAHDVVVWMKYASTVTGHTDDGDAGIIDDLSDPTDPPEPTWDDGRQSGHDVAVIGDTLLDFHAFDGTVVHDNADSFAPVERLTLDDDSIRFHHSGRLSGDGPYLYINDEHPINPSDYPDITIWDLDTGELVGDFRHTDATRHNSPELCDRLIVSYYTKGLVLFDIGDPTELVLLDEYDTDPDAEGEGFFLGAWGVYPYTRSGHVLVSDVEKALYVFRLE